MEFHEYTDDLDALLETLDRHIEKQNVCLDLERKELTNDRAEKWRQERLLIAIRNRTTADDAYIRRLLAEGIRHELHDFSCKRSEFFRLAYDTINDLWVTSSVRAFEACQEIVSNGVCIEEVCDLYKSSAYRFIRDSTTRIEKFKKDLESLYYETHTIRNKYTTQGNYTLTKEQDKVVRDLDRVNDELYMRHTQVLLLEEQARVLNNLRNVTIELLDKAKALEIKKRLLNTPDDNHELAPQRKKFRRNIDNPMLMR